MKISIVNKYKNVGSARHPNTIYCGRGSALGNPWPIQGEDTRDVVCDRFHEALFNGYRDRTLGEARVTQLVEIMELAQTPEGVALECFCVPQRCHCESTKQLVEQELSNPTGYLIKAPEEANTAVQYYQGKDAIKFSICNQMITRGAPSSSSERYRTDPPVECYINGAKPFESTDIVGISVNGKRYNRVKADAELITQAAEANVTFVTDNEYNANRPFNTGEREVAELLSSLGYTFESTKDRGIWTK